MNDSRQTQPSGFMALLATMVIGLVLLLVTVEIGLLGWRTRFAVLAAEQKAQSVTLAHSCADWAVAEFISNSSFVGGATTTIGADSCYVSTIDRHIPRVNTITVRVVATVLTQSTILETVFVLGQIHQDELPASGPVAGSVQPLVSRSTWHELTE